MDLFAHAIAQRLVYELMALHPGFPTKGCAHDEGFEVLTIAGHLQMLALEMIFDIALYIFGSNQGVLLKKPRKIDILALLTDRQCRSLYPVCSIRRLNPDSSSRQPATTARLT